MTARQGLLKDQTAARARLAATTHSLLIRQIKSRLKQIERDLPQLSEAIDAIVAADEELQKRSEILTSIPGIAKVTACAILSDMPELGNLSGNQAAKLIDLTLSATSTERKRSLREWHAVRSQLAIMFEDSYPMPIMPAIISVRGSR